MKLKIENIGKIREAEIHFNGITVIGGVNDTGKSTVAKSLFALCNAFHNTGDAIHNERVVSIVSAIAKNMTKFFPLLIYRYPQLFIDDATNILNLSNHDDPENVLKIIEEIPKRVHEEISNNLPAKHRVDFNFYSRNLKDYKEKVYEDIAPAINMEDIIILGEIINRALDAEFLGQVCCLFEKQGTLELYDDDNEKVTIIVDKITSSKQNISITNPSFQSEKVIYIDNAVAIDENASLGFNPFNPPASVPMSRIFGHKNVLRSDLKKSPENYNLVDNLLAREKLSLIIDKVNQVSKGVLIRDNGTWLYSFTDKESNFYLNVENISTGILAFTILRRLIENGSLQDSGILILDEPETHLHPAWQNIFAEIIVLLCKEFQFKILLNTHSHYFLSAIETFSKKYKIDDRCKYYLSCNEGNDNIVNIRDVTGDSEEIYKKFLQPIQDIQDLKDVI